MDGSNETFSLANIPVGASLHLFRNGLFMTMGVDYTLSGQTITFLPNAGPNPGDILTASYRIEDTSRSLTSLSGQRGILQLLCRTASASEALSRRSDASCSIPIGALTGAGYLRVSFTLVPSGPGIMVRMSGTVDGRQTWANSYADPTIGTTHVAEFALPDIVGASFRDISLTAQVDGAGELVTIARMQIAR